MAEQERRSFVQALAIDHAKEFDELSKGINQVLQLHGREVGSRPFMERFREAITLLGKPSEHEARRFEASKAAMQAILGREDRTLSAPEEVAEISVWHGDALCDLFERDRPAGEEDA